MVLKKSNDPRNAFLFCFIQACPPISKLTGKLYFTTHKLYSIKVIVGVNLKTQRRDLY